MFIILVLNCTDCKMFYAYYNDGGVRMGVSTRDRHNSCFNRTQTFYFENSYFEGLYEVCSWE